MTSTSSTLEAQLEPKEILHALRRSRGNTAADELVSAHFPHVLNPDHLKMLVDDADVTNLNKVYVRACEARDEIQKSILATMNRVRSHGKALGEKANEYRKSAEADFDKFIEAQNEVTSIRSDINTLKDVLEFRRRNA